MSIKRYNTGPHADSASEKIQIKFPGYPEHLASSSNQYKCPQMKKLVVSPENLELRPFET
jgi:hypothetical protein